MIDMKHIAGIAGCAIAGCGIVGLTCGVLPAAAASPFHDQPASVRSLPGDNLPPFEMLDDAGRLIPAPPMPAAAVRRGRGSAPESSARGPTLALAIEAARAALASCAASGYRIGVTVIDSNGEARAMLSADGADGSHVFVAMRKALAALAFNMPSSAVGAHLAGDAALLARVTPAMFIAGGALPIMAGNELIGAIGASGAGGAVLGQQDESCARAGLKRIQPKL
jgi:uncharacterized protein GlcG (DUF336 family)